MSPYSQILYIQNPHGSKITPLGLDDIKVDLIMLDWLCFSHCCFPMTTKAVKDLILWNAVPRLCSKPFDLLLNSSNIMSSGCVVAVLSLFDLYLNSLHCYVMSQ